MCGCAPDGYDAPVQPPVAADTWIELLADRLDPGVAHDWAVTDRSGAVVVFSGTVRDHAEGREGVTALTYEAYESEALARLGEIAETVRRSWPAVERIALLHRVGRLELGEVSVLAVVSSPHRPDAFEASRFAIDTLKSSVPIWKHEEWADGNDWGTGATPIRPVDEAAQR
jgi:molybdopterin synthase catalytic subunit